MATSTPTQSEKTSRSRSNINSLQSTQLYHDWYGRVACGPPNDYIIAITADPQRTGVSGTGKSTLGGVLAREHFDVSVSGFEPEKQITLDPQELAYEIYPNTEEGSCLIFDEAQGTPSSTGLNSKRAMKEESLQAINTVATRRRDRKTLIVISQSLKSIVTDLYDFIDSWLLINDDLNYWATHYGVHPDVFDLESHKTRTPGIEDLTWDPLRKNCDTYSVLEDLKSEAVQRGDTTEDDGSVMTDEQQKILAQSLRDEGWTLREVAAHKLIDYSRGWVSDHTEAEDDSDD